MDWVKCNYDDVSLDEPVKVYRDFTIALAKPNGGIIGVSIWNENKTIVECLDTSNFKKYSDKRFHISQEMFRINKILHNPSKMYLLLSKIHIDKLRFILKHHKIKCSDKRYGSNVISAIEKSGLSTQEIWKTIQKYPSPTAEINDLPLFKN